MDHREFVSNIDPDTRATLTELSDGPALRRLAFHLCAILVLSAWVLARLPLWWVAVPFLGVFLAFLFTLQHECTHKTPFKSPWLNELVGHLTGLVLVQPFLWFRYFHLAHHKYTNDPERDPELAGDAKPDTWGAFLWHLSSLGYWGGKLKTLVENAFGSPEQCYLPSHTRPKVQREALLLWLCYLLAGVILVLHPGLIWVWPGPLIFGFPVLRLYLLAEHGRCPTVANMFENTRTTLTNRVVRLLAWNMPYHAEHHVYPSVPFHRLPQLHSLSVEHLRQLERGYAHFSVEYVRDMKSADNADW